MNNAKKTFLLLSTLILIVLSPYMNMVVLKNGIYDIVQPTLGQFSLLIFTGKFSLVILPTCYLVMSLLSKKKYYPISFGFIVTVVALTNTYFFIHAWSYGLQYQGLIYTIFIAFLNFICFFLVYTLLYQYKKGNKFIFIYIANFLLMLILTFVAFPWLGESI